MKKKDKELLQALKRENGMDAHTIAIVRGEVIRVKKEKSIYYRREEKLAQKEGVLGR
jgi:hypothetical protein